MELVQLKITASLDTSRYGAMSYGDILRTDAAYAKHLVDDCKAAVYMQEQATPEPQPVKPKRTRKAKDQS